MLIRIGADYDLFEEILNTALPSQSEKCCILYNIKNQVFQKPVLQQKLLYLSINNSFFIMPLCNISQIATGVPYSESPRNIFQSGPILIKIRCNLNCFKRNRYQNNVKTWCQAKRPFWAPLNYRNMVHVLSQRRRCKSCRALSLFNEI